jgi:ParB family chromosome partitioning protein
MREPPRRLGRGLAALLGQDEEQTQVAPAQALRMIDVRALSPNPGQPRAAMDEAALADLAQSIAQQGVLQPILVRPADPAHSRFEIVAGERRWRAAQQAGLDTVPCIVQHLDHRAASLAALVENLQREDLSPLEEAEGFRKVLDNFGVSQDDLAGAIGKSRSHVANTIRLLQLPPGVRDALRAGQISAGHARALLTHAQPEAALAAVLARRLNVRETESLVLDPEIPADRATPANPTAGDRSPGPSPSDPDLAALERSLSERLGLVVRISARSGSGKLVISFQNHDQLDGLISLLAPP